MAGSGTGTRATAYISPSTAYESAEAFSAIWIWDNSAGQYINRTIESQNSGGTAFAIFSDVNDWLYIGSQNRFDLIVFFLLNAGAVTTPSWYYYDGDSAVWSQFLPTYAYNFSVDGAEGVGVLPNWTAREFTSSWPHSASPPDGRARYWIRVNVAAVSSTPMIDHIKKRPYAAYCTASDVAKLLQINDDFSSETTPTRETVEDYINAAQSYIDYKTQRSWRINYKVDEYQDFNIAGIKLVEQNPQAVCKLEVWNGGTWETKTQGRQQHYFLIPDTGMVIFSRYFMLPARLQSYNAPVWLWGWAEFTFPVRIAYLYGRNIETDAKQGRVAWDLCRKQAAIELLTAHDYSVLIASGTDKVSLREKIDIWTRELDEKLDAMRGWVTF